MSDTSDREARSDHSLDARLLRLMLVVDGGVKRPAVIGYGVVAAQLAELVLADCLIDSDGLAVAISGHEPAPVPLRDLLSRIAASAPRCWDRWFWRTGEDPAKAYESLLVRLTHEGTIETRSTGFLGAGRRVVRDLAPELAYPDRVALSAWKSETLTPSLAVLMELMTICQAKKWIPLTPPAEADFLALVPDLDPEQRRTLRALIDGLIIIRHVAMSGGTRDTVDGGGG